MNEHTSNNVKASEQIYRAWTTLFQQNCSEWFQLALLLCADPELAEASVAAMLECIDYSRAPSAKASDCTSRQIVLESLAHIRSGHCSSSDLDRVESLLQPGLGSIVKLPLLPRVCFVLRRLLGYGVAVCTDLLHVEEDVISEALQIAFLHLSITASTQNPPASRYANTDFHNLHERRVFKTGCRVSLKV